MNQRMIELYREACEFAYNICREEGREGGTQDHIWNTLSTGKFAELIVRECSRVARNTNLEDVEGGDSDVLRAASDQIKEHFGVRE